MLAQRAHIARQELLVEIKRLQRAPASGGSTGGAGGGSGGSDTGG